MLITGRSRTTYSSSRNHSAVAICTKCTRVSSQEAAGTTITTSYLDSSLVICSLYEGIYPSVAASLREVVFTVLSVKWASEAHDDFLYHLTVSFFPRKYCCDRVSISRATPNAFLSGFCNGGKRSVYSGRVRDAVSEQL